MRFGGQVLEGSSTPLTEHSNENARLFTEAFATWAYEQIETERRNFAKFHTKRIPSVPLIQLKQQVRALAGHAISLDDVSPKQKVELISLSKLTTHVGTDFMAKLGESHSRYAGVGQRKQRPTRTGWQPKHKRKFDRRRDR